MGALYVDPYAVIWWQEYTRRSALNPLVLSAGAYVWDAIASTLAGGGQYEEKEPSPVWAVVAQQRVVVWNGGPSDGP